MSKPISDYGIVGDTHTTALIARDGSLDWLCWPRHDSPAVFLGILDGAKGGRCDIAWEGGAEASRRYLDDTNVLETTFRTPVGVATLTDFMPVNPPGTAPEEGPDGDGESRLIRIVRCVEGSVAGCLTICPAFDYARCPCTPRDDGEDAVLFEAGEHRIRVTGSHPVVIEDGAAVLRFRLAAGERVHVVLTQGEEGEVAPVEGLEGALLRQEQTERYWRGWIGRCGYRGDYGAAVRRSALLLKLLTYGPTGAIIAAPTLGLPEAVPGNRNFDYRYAWLRDASFTVTAFVNLGYKREAEEYLRFLRGADGSRGRDLHLLHAIDGEAPEHEEELSHLAGWNGVGPVTVGNAAAGQTQNDIFGELLLALEDYLEANGFDAPPALRDGLPELVCNLAERAMEMRDKPDQGIWEVRGEAQHFVHSKALLWVALDRAASLADRLGIDRAHRDRWGECAASLRDEYLRHGWNEARGAYVQAYGSDALDASVLRAALFGAIPLDDGRFRRTLDAVGRELADGDLVYRYRTDDGMEGEEATFAACAFWLVSCLALAGQLDEAHARFGRLLARANDLGLFSEEIDAATGELRGNFPQGFTHMAVINHAVRLQRLERERQGVDSLAADA